MCICFIISTKKDQHCFAFAGTSEKAVKVTCMQLYSLNSLAQTYKYMWLILCELLCTLWIHVYVSDYIREGLFNVFIIVAVVLGLGSALIYT